MGARAISGLVAIGALLALPGPALAAELSIKDGTVTYRAAPNEFNGLSVELGDSYVNLRSVGLLGPPAEVSTGPGCQAAGDRSYHCEGPELAGVDLSLGDRDEWLYLDNEGGLWGQRPVRVDVGDGNNSVQATEVPNATLIGGSGEDDFEGNGVMRGGDGINTIRGGPGDDVIEGGRSDDRFWGNGGDDVLRGGPKGPGDRTFNEVLYGGPGADVLESQDPAAMYDDRTEPVTVTLDGRANDGEEGEGDNVLAPGAVGGQGGDVLIGNDQGNELTGDPYIGESWDDPRENGDDRIDGGGGDDYLNGAGGADEIRGGDGYDRVGGDGGKLSGDDVLDGGPDRDYVAGDAGADQLTGGLGPDRIEGGTGPDRVEAVDWTGGDAPPPDYVDCGTGDSDLPRGPDTVRADATDYVDSHCSHVERVGPGQAPASLGTCDVPLPPSFEQLIGPDCKPITDYPPRAAATEPVAPRTVRLRVRCGRSSCRGKARLSARVRRRGSHRTAVKTIGTRRFSIRRGRRASVTIPLSKYGRRLVAQRGRLRARAQITLRARGAARRTSYSRTVILRTRR